MRNWIIFFAGLLVFAIIESSFPVVFLIPSFFLAFEVTNRQRLALITAFVGGIMLDAIGFRFFGLMTLFCLVILAISHGMKELFPQRLVYKTVNFVLSMLFFEVLLMLPTLPHPVDFGTILVVNFLVVILAIPSAEYLYELLRKDKI